MSVNFMIAVIKSVLHTNIYDRLTCDNLAREIANFIAANESDFIAEFGAINESTVESFAREFISATSK